MPNQGKDTNFPEGSGQHPIDPEQVSAYYDGALEAEERARVEAHLADCETCRERLSSYAFLGSAIRDSGMRRPVPLALDRHMQRLSNEGPQDEIPQPPRLFSFQRAGLAALAAVAVLVAASLVTGLPFGGRGPAVAAAYPCDRPEDCLIAVQFSGPVDHQAVERSVRIDPPVPVAMTWQTDTLLVKPKAALTPAASYTLTLEPDRSTNATPVAVRFITGGAGTPVALASPDQPAPPAIAPTSEAGPTVTAVAAAALTSTPSPTASPCPIQPIRGFGLLYQSEPAIASRLGCATEPERGVELVVAPADKGVQVWRSDRNETLVLLNTGRWQVLDATPTAQPSGNRLAGAVEEFEHGLLVWTAERIIYVLYSDGSWTSAQDHFVEPTPASSPVSGSTPIASPPASATRTATPASTPVPDTCAVQPIRGFGLVYHQYPSVADRLGCALDAEKAVRITRQAFEGGVMLQRGDNRQILVLKSDNTWSSHPDTYQEGETLPDAGTPPAGLVVPSRGFGKLWRQDSDVRQALGWATAAGQGLDGAVETFANGQMLWTSDRAIYVLYHDGTFERFADTFVDPTVTPAG